MSTLRGKHLIVCEQVLINSREVADNPGFVSLFEGKRRANKVPFFFLHGWEKTLALILDHQFF